MAVLSDMIRVLINILHYRKQVCLFQTFKSLRRNSNRNDIISDVCKATGYSESVVLSLFSCMLVNASECG